MTERKNIIERIANLRGLAASTGSDNEALAAVNAADKLMRAYRIEEAEIAMAEASGEIEVEVVHDYAYNLMVGKNRHKVQACIWSIADYCEVKSVLKRRWGDQYLHIIGDKPDVELAKWMVAMVRDAMDRDYENWKRGQQAVGTGAKAAFQTSMASVINARLHHMAAERAAERRQAVAGAQALLNKPDAEALGVAVANGRIQELTSSALVVVAAAEVKRVEVSRAFASAYAGVKLGTSSGFNYRGGTSAAGAGRDAGQRLNLGRALQGNARARLN